MILSYNLIGERIYQNSGYATGAEGSILKAEGVGVTFAKYQAKFPDMKTLWEQYHKQTSISVSVEEFIET